MVLKKSDWNEIQRHELAYHLGKDKNRVPEFNIPYWKSLLKKIEPFVAVTEEMSVLEVACGCCGILMALDKGQLTGVDPLMDEYLEHFDYLRAAKPDWVCCAAENMEWPESFDLIFTINALDHMLDPGEAIARMDRYLRPGGHLVISLNCHVTDFFHGYYRRFYRYIDSFHPHHFRVPDVTAMLPGYHIRHIEDIDALYFPQLRQYREKVLKIKKIRWNKVLSYAFNPFKYPVAMARLFGGYRIHRSRDSHKPIFATYLFILQKPAVSANGENPLGI